MDWQMASLFAAGGILVATWKYIQSLLVRFSGLFIQHIDIGGDVGQSLLKIIVTEGKDLNSFAKRYHSLFSPTKEDGSLKVVIWERSIPFQITKFYVWRNTLVWVRIESSGDISLKFLKGQIDIEKELLLSADRLNQYNSTEKFIKYNRFFLHKIYGKHRRMSVQSTVNNSSNDSKNTNNSNAVPIDEVGINAIHRFHRFVNYKYEELGWHQRSVDPFENYILDATRQELLQTIDNWYKGKDWFKTKRLVWKRGYTLQGEPGTGKTAFVRAVAIKYDLPIFVLDLASMDNEEFEKAWREAMCHAPCVILLEDIDSVFHGRKNISGGMLTFDCLINHLDGVEEDQGRLLFITTNHIEHLELALTRPGRTDGHFKFEYLNYDAKKSLAEQILDHPEQIESILNACQDMGTAEFKAICENIAIKTFFKQKYSIKNEIESVRKKSVEQARILCYNVTDPSTLEDN